MNLFSQLWTDYLALNPGAKRLHAALEEREGKVINDHIALRTFNLPGIGIDTMAQPFEALGYVAKDDYTFTEKKLYARHYEHSSDPLQPKVFISELLLEKVSQELNREVQNLIASVPDQIWHSKPLPILGRPWNLPHSAYQKMYSESEYAAWTCAYGFRANHFTVFFNSLKSFKDLNELNQFIKSLGYSMNNSGGEIKGSPSDYLEQSSTMAEEAIVSFSDGNFQIPSCYYEFAKRYPLPQGQLFQGFVAKSADKIFESTNKNPAHK